MPSANTGKSFYDLHPAALTSQIKKVTTIKKLLEEGTPTSEELGAADKKMHEVAQQLKEATGTPASSKKRARSS